MLRWLLFIIIIFIVDFYAFQSVKTLNKNKLISLLYWFVSVAIMVNFIYQFTHYDRAVGLTQILMLSIALMVLSLVPKITVLFVMLGEDIFRFFKPLPIIFPPQMHIFQNEELL